MAAPAGVYPFATQDGKAIPLDIINPSALLKRLYTANASSAFTIPAGYSVGVFYSSQGAVVSFGVDKTNLADNVLADSTLFIPSDVLVTAAFNPGAAYVASASGIAGVLYIQFIQKWSGLALNTQYQRK